SMLHEGGDITALVAARKLSMPVLAIGAGGGDFTLPSGCAPSKPARWPGDVARDEAHLEELRAMLRAGSSLGGARPKAHVLASDGNVAIAEFPSSSTGTWNVMALEKTALDLAYLAGITVPASTLLTVDGRQVLVIVRFDRAGSKEASVGYVSALTMLEARDGDTSETA
ncbi:MAG: HipA domain-containing protein, partial [Acidimicrobiales bacterium]